MTRAHRELSAAAGVALAFLAAGACGGGGTSGARDAGGGGGAGGACPGAAALTAAAPACNTVVNDAQPVPFTARTGAAAAPTGGSIADGVYHVTRAEGYDGATPAGRRITIAVLDGASRFLWAGEVLDAAGANVIATFRATAQAAAAGTGISFTVDCASSSPSPVPPALSYTATATELVLSLGASVTTYTRAGCP